jgi:hypothetical protein
MWTLELTHPDGTTTTIDGRDMTDVTVAQILTGVSRWSVTVPKSPSLEEWRFATAALRFDAGLRPQPIIRGRVVAIQTTESSAETTIRGKDHVEDLRRPRDGENGIVFDVSSQTGADAIRDFYDEPFFDDLITSVIEPTPTQVNDDLVVQSGSSTSELSDVFDLDPADPFIIESDELRQSQSGFFRSAQNAERNGTTTVSRDDFEGGQGEQLSDISMSIAETFSLDHTIPSGEAVAAYRFDATNGSHGELELKVDGQVVDNVIEDAYAAGVQWAKAPVSFDVSGSVNIELDMTSTNGDVDLDALALVDGRFDHTFGDSLNSNNRLAAPEKYPNGATVAASEADATWNIETARLDVAMNDLGGGQGLQLQFTDEWLPSDGSEANTDFIEVDNPGATATITGRVRMDRFGSRDDATPTEGFKRQTLSAWELRVDTNDVAVIEDETYSGSYFRVWKQLHDDANLVCAAEYGKVRKLTTLQLGDETRSAEVIPLDADLERDTRKFANRLRGIGDDGNLEVEATNQAAVEEAGEVIEGEPVIALDEANSERLLSQVRNELAAAVATDRPSGTLDIEPRAIVPGFAYDLPEVGVEPVTEVTFGTESGQLRVGQPPDDLSGLLADLQIEIQNEN